ncbi:MAG TPA: GPW/gp25 family protein [Chloroflexia bacterium]|nr:GPW/gp25 family protein [Chloroflexia bacterium]
MDKNAYQDKSFIGSGWAYRPGSGIGINGEGNIALSREEQDIAKSIYIILSTAPGERVMRTEFGCGIHDLVFASPGPQLFGLVSYYVTQALGRWEPRIEVAEVNSRVDPKNPECLLVDINYTIRKTNSNRNLVYPFYVIPRGQD